LLHCCAGGATEITTWQGQRNEGYIEVADVLRFTYECTRARGQADGDPFLNLTALSEGVKMLERGQQQASFQVRAHATDIVFGLTCFWSQTEHSGQRHPKKIADASFVFGYWVLHNSMWHALNPLSRQRFLARAAAQGPEDQALPYIYLSTWSVSYRRSEHAYALVQQFTC